MASTRTQKKATSSSSFGVVRSCPKCEEPLLIITSEDTHVMPINITTGGPDNKGPSGIKATTILASAVAIGLITLGFVAISWRAASCSTGQQHVYVPVQTGPQTTVNQSGSE